MTGPGSQNFSVTRSFDLHEEGWGGANHIYKRLPAPFETTFIGTYCGISDGRASIIISKKDTRKAIQLGLMNEDSATLTIPAAAFNAQGGNGLSNGRRTSLTFRTAPQVEESLGRRKGNRIVGQSAVVHVTTTLLHVKDMGIPFEQRPRTSFSNACGIPAVDQVINCNNWRGASGNKKSRRFDMD